MFGEKKLKEVIDFDRDEGYLLREKLIENGWQVIHDFHDGTILSKFDNYYREETIAFLDDYTQGYEYIAFHSKGYASAFISYAVEKNSLDDLYFRTARENTIEWYPVSEVVLIDGTPAFIKHHHIPDLEAEGYRKKHLEESPNLRMKDLSEKIRAYCDVNDIKLENTDIFYIARRICNQVVVYERDEIAQIGILIEEILQRKVKYADRSTTFKAVMTRKACSSVYVSAKDFKEARKAAERYFSKNDDFYSEENISIHTLENWEVVVDDEVEK